MKETNNVTSAEIIGDQQPKPVAKIQSMPTGKMILQITMVGKKYRPYFFNRKGFDHIKTRKIINTLIRLKRFVELPPKDGKIWWARVK
jgi:hypothetical protein